MLEITIIKEAYGYYLSEALSIYTLNEDNSYEFLCELNLDGFDTEEEAWAGFVNAFEN